MALVLVLILANGLFAMSEMAIVSARKARLQQAANEGDRRAQAALDLASAPSRFLSTVQAGVTLIGVLAGAFGGATIAGQLAGALAGLPVIGGYADAVALGIVVITITFLSIVIGELVPKQLALRNPERIAAAVARPVSLLSAIGRPAVAVLTASTDAIVRLIGVHPSNEPPVTEEEIKVLIDEGTRAGVFAEAEQDLVERVLRLGDMRVASLMVPRLSISWLDVSDSPEVIRQKVDTSPHSRFPVCQGGLDQVVGVVEVKSILASSLAGQAIDLRALAKPPLLVPEQTHVLPILEMFRETGLHIALAVDEYGGIQGMLTLYDVLEAIVGDLPSDDERDEHAAVRRDDGSWLLDGMLSVDEVKEILSIKEMPGEGDYDTLGGFVMMQLGRIPSPADHFDSNGIRFEVVDMDGNRVDKVLAVPPSSDQVTSSVGDS
jgi:putative hemolysin